MPPLNATIELNGGAAVVSYNPAKWGNLETNKEGVISLERLTGDGYAAIIAERVGVPTAAAVDTLIEELRQKHPELVVLTRETRPIDGHEVCCLKYSCQQSGIPMIVYAYCHGGLAGTLQVRTCASTAAFDGCEPDFTELLNGLQIRSLAHPRVAQMRQGLRFAAKATAMATPVIGITFLRFWLRTDWRTGALIAGGLAVGFFLFAWAYGLVKYRLR